MEVRTKPYARNFNQQIILKITHNLSLISSTVEMEISILTRA